MAHRLTTNTYGKAFLWLVAIAIALLVEGFLSQQFGVGLLSGGASVEVAAEGPAAEPTLQLDRVAGTIVRALELFRVIR